MAYGPNSTRYDNTRAYDSTRHLMPRMHSLLTAKGTKKMQETTTPAATNTTVATTTTNKVHAYSFLEKAGSEMKDRASQRDNSPEGERSMASTVKAFNALTGHNLNESEGWEFMILLKLVRGRQGSFREDDYVDAAAYSGLLGECASSTQKRGK